MKRFLCVLVLLSLLGQSAQAQWANVTPPGATSVWHLFPVSADTAFTLTYDSLTSLLRSTNGGQTWEPLPLPAWALAPEVFLKGIFFVDGQSGYLYGDELIGGGFYGGGTEGGWLARTSDGGQNWLYLPFAAPPVGFTSPNFIHFFDMQHGVTALTTGLGYNSIQVTHDGGITWTQEDSLAVFPQAVRLRPDGDGSMFAWDFAQNKQTVFSSDDFGHHWTPAGLPGALPAWSELRQGLLFENQFFVDAQTGFRVSTTQLSPNVPYATVEKTIDAGQNWTVEDVHWHTPYYEIKSRDGIVWIKTQNEVFRHALTSALHQAPELVNGLSVSPNPARTGDVRLQLENGFSGPAEIRLHAIDGALIKQQSVDFQNGVVSLSTAGLAGGTYVATVVAKDRIAAVRLVIP